MLDVSSHRTLWAFTKGFVQAECSSKAKFRWWNLNEVWSLFFFFPFFNFWCDLLDKTVFGKHFSLVFSLLFLPPLLKGEWIDITCCIPTCLCSPWCIAGTFSLAQMVLFLQRWQRFSGCKQVRPQKSGKLKSVSKDQLESHIQGWGTLWHVAVLNTGMGYSSPLACMLGVSGSRDIGGVMLLQQLSNGQSAACVWRCLLLCVERGKALYPHCNYSRSLRTAVSRSS